MPVRDILNAIQCDLASNTINYRVDRQSYIGSGQNITIISSDYHRTVINGQSDLKDAPAQVKAIAAVFFRGN